MLREKWPVFGRHEQAATWLQIWTDLGRASRTIDAYARGLAEYLLLCEREHVDPVTANRAHVAVFVRELTPRPSLRRANVVGRPAGPAVLRPAQRRDRRAARGLRPMAARWHRDHGRLRPGPGPRRGSPAGRAHSQDRHRVHQARRPRPRIPVLCRKAGVPAADVRGNIDSHRARSTIATQLDNAKEPMTLFELQASLGHTGRRCRRDDGSAAVSWLLEPLADVPHPMARRPGRSAHQARPRCCRS